MIWFVESIAAAITTAKQNNAIFIVYIRGDDDDTKSMDESWEDKEVERICKDGGVVAIRLDATSNECAQFSAIYPVVCIPSVSIIDGNNGMYVEGIAGAATPAELGEKIKKTIMKKNGTKSNQETLTTTDGDSQAASEPSISATPHQSPTSETPQTEAATPQAEAASTATNAAQMEQSAPAQQSSESVQERADRLRRKLAEKREKEEKKRKEEERQKEIQRRENGKLMQQQRRKQEEMETIRAVEEQMKERQNKRRVKEQMEKDKMEKKVKFQAEKREKDKIKDEEIERKRRRMESANVQFRLPDGSTFTNRFQSSATFSEVYEYIKQKIPSEDLRKAFVMSTMYPRRNYDSSDMGRTLLELNLVPDARFIVLPDPNVSSNSLFTMILWPFLALWSFLTVIIFGSSNATQPTNSIAEASPQSDKQGEQGEDLDHPTEEPGPNTGARPKSSYGRRPNAGRTMRREGNICRFAPTQDDGDENNTWNGNSTQQN